MSRGRQRGYKAKHKAKPASPSPRKRLSFFILGALTGGTVGFAIAMAGPVPPPWWSSEVIWWAGGLALVCGALGALQPDRYFRPRGAPRNWQQ